MQTKTKSQARALRVRSSLKSSGRPRLTVFRSNQHIWAQIIDDLPGHVIVSVNTKTLAFKKDDTKSTRAKAVGSEIAKLALEKKIKQVVFDRGAYKFHGRVKTLAEAARAGGLEF